MLYWLGKEYMTSQNREFDLERHVIYSDDFKEIFEKIRNAKDGDYIWFDEGGRVILAEDWNSANSKKLKKMFSEIRTKHLCIGFAVPFAFTKIDSKYREALINFWGWVPKRGFAVIFEPIIHPTIGGYLEKVIEKKIKLFSWSDSLNEGFEEKLEMTLRQIPSFLDVVRFPPMPQKDHEKYLKLRDKYVYDERDVEDNKLKISDKLLVSYVDTLIESGKGTRESFRIIGEKIGLNPSAVKMRYYRAKKKSDDNSESSVKINSTVNPKLTAVN